MGFGFTEQSAFVNRHTTMNKMTKILIGVLLGLQFSCNNSDTKNKMTVMEEINIENQGVHIEYDDSKIGDTVLLFIHGFGIDKDYWKSQTTFFSKKYRVVTLDLPGFGQSGKNRNSWTVEDFSKDVSKVLTQLDLKNVILIGHSMSGAIALETALNNQTRIIGLVGVDNFKNYGMVMTPQLIEQQANIYKAAKADFKKTISDYTNQALLAPSTDTTIRKRVLNDMTNTDSTIGVSCMEQGDKYPINEKLKLLKKTLYLINSDLEPTDTSGFKKDNIHYTLFNIGSTGHYPMLEKPNDFNLLLQQVIDKIKK
jgi:pimeloyl-ACP methyl ester carboxylesterase